MKVRSTLRAVSALAALSLTFAACGSSDEETSTASTAASGAATTSASASMDTIRQCETLNMITWEGYANDAYVRPFEERYGIKVKPTYASSDTELVAKAATQRGAFPVVSVNGAVRARQAAAGAIQPLDVSKLEHYDGAPQQLRDALVIDGETWGTPQNWGVNPFIYDRASLSADEVTSYDVLWNPALRGKLSLWNEISIIYIGATVLGFNDDVFDLSDDQLEQIKERMLTLAPQVRTTWSSGGELVQLFTNGEVAASPGWASIYTQLEREGGGRFAQAVFDDSGANAWVDGIGIGAEVSEPCKEAAYAWINWMTDPEMQATLVEETGYGPAQPDAARFLSRELAETSGATRAEELLRKGIVRTDPARPDVYQRVADEIVAGFR
ncbi:MAG TPA: extracellular solute-binding protein [Conexibacter sp.]|nr:extracellular solute-binding protein [Conexibacter sp.]